MRPKPPVVHPIQCIQEQIVAFKAALTACRANLSSKAVHRLRANSRRIDSQMVLINQLHDLRLNHHEYRQLRREFKRIRRVAGKIRDLDAERELILRHDTSIAPDEARRLGRRLKRRRDKEAADLRKILRSDQTKLYSALDRLSQSLDSAEPFSLPATQVVKLARAWFVGHCRSTETAEDLHATRKAARLARYMVETVQRSASATKMAKSLKDIQRAGGEWHDSIQLLRFVGGDRAETQAFSKSFSKQSDVNLKAYRIKVGRGLPSI